MRKIIYSIKRNKNLYNTLLIIFFLYNLSLFLSSENQKLNFKYLFDDSEITLTIKGNDRQPILNNENIKQWIATINDYKNLYFNIKPSEILVNDEKINELDFYVNNLEGEENIITIKFNQTIKNCSAMFYGLENIIKINLSKFDASEVLNMEFMFYGCSNLMSIDLTNFDTSSVTIMNNMFDGCSTLISLDLSSFDTSSVIYIFQMFEDCSNLISLDLSNFNTSSVTYMNEMFSKCSHLISLDLSNFNTSSVIRIDSMFERCSHLKTLNLSSFYTPNVVNMVGLFYCCYELISLDLSNFDTSSVTDITNMFSNCENLISLDLGIFDTSSISDTNNIYSMFYGCSDNLIYCINIDDNKADKILQIINDNYNFKDNNDCDNICFVKNKKIILETQVCVLDCNNDLYIYEYNNICYSTCPNGTHNIDDNICIKDNYQKSSNIISSNNIDNFSSNINTIDIKDLQESTKINSQNIIQFEDYINMTDDLFYKNNSDHTTSISFDSLASSEIGNQSNNDDKNLNNKSITIYNTNDYVEYFYNKYSLADPSHKNDIISFLRNEIENNTLTIINIINGEKEDIKIKEDNIIYHITSFLHQNNNEYNNISNILLGECEIKLRNYYNISNNITLLILKIDIYEKGLLIPIIEYEIYNSKTKEKLDLSICKDYKAKIYITVSINENHIFKHNCSHEYYNDICYPYTTEHKTDITLKDRRNEFIKNNMSLCEKNCEYKGYNISTKKVLCECFFKEKISFLSEIMKNKNKLLINFIDIRNSININVLKCYKKVFNKEALIKNIGNYIITSIIILIFILFILFKIKGFDNLKKK